jgi:broad specificity phosphatase PhoE
VAANPDAITTFLLVRHATCEQTANVLFGRTLDAPLDIHGEAQAQALGEHVARDGELLVESSPRLRARQTAAAIAACVDTESVNIAADLDEVDFGEWSGRSFAELAGDPRWREWNERRGSSRTPAGDDMARVQARVMNHLRQLHKSQRGQRIAVVTHAEVIRAAVMHCLYTPMDVYWRLQINPASLTVLRMSDSDVVVGCVNYRLDHGRLDRGRHDHG